MNVRRALPMLAVVGVVVAALVVSSGSGEGAESSEDRVAGIADQLRCPTCQGLSVADSSASTARAIRDDIARRVDEGETDGQIKRAYVDRYGEWILLRPRTSGLGALLWAVPAVVILTAAGVLLLAVRRWQREPDLRATDDDRAMVERAMEQGTGR